MTHKFLETIPFKHGIKSLQVSIGDTTWLDGLSASATSGLGKLQQLLAAFQFEIC
jgi:hypothetical protein